MEDDITRYDLAIFSLARAARTEDPQVAADEMLNILRPFIDGLSAHDAADRLATFNLRQAEVLRACLESLVSIFQELGEDITVEELIETVQLERMGLQMWGYEEEE